MEGTVEICLNGTWGTIVDDGWGGQEAKVVCRQLNLAVACKFKCHTSSRVPSLAFITLTKKFKKILSV